MDVDMIRSSSAAAATDDNNMEMMTMMMQMEKLPEFCCEAPHFSNTITPIILPEIQFSAANTSECRIVPPAQPLPILHNVSSPPTLLNQPPTLPFMGTPIQEPMTPPPLQANKYKYSHPYSHANSYLSSIEKKNSMAAMREMIFRIAAMQPIHIDPESIKPPKRRNVKISKDPQSVAARHRRERISERIRILQRLVPGGTKMDTASMLDEAIHYVKFLKKQVQSLEQAGANRPPLGVVGFSGAATMANVGYSSLVKAACQSSSYQNVGNMQMLR